MTDEQMAALIKQMGGMSGQEAALQAQLEQSRALREPLNNDRNLAGNLTRAFRGAAQGYQQGRYNQGMQDLARGRAQNTQDIVDLLLKKNQPPMNTTVLQRRPGEEGDGDIGF